MVAYQVEDTFTCSANYYWNMFFSAPYNEGLWEFLEIERVEEKFCRTGTELDEEIVRVHRLTPRREVPAIMKKLISGAITYVEHNHFRRRENAMQVKTTTGFLADKFSANGVYRLEEIEPRVVQRIWQGECTCTIPLIGDKIARLIADEIKRSYEKTSEFTHRWIADHPEVAR